MQKEYRKINPLLQRVIIGIFTVATMLLLTIVDVDATATITRYDGYSRENVAENVARAQFSYSDKVILVNRDKFPDAISATNISQGRYPVLYTHAGHVSESTLQLLNEMTLDEIFVLGGTLSINESVVSQLENETGVKVTRLAGRSRYDANVSAIRDNYSQKDHVVLASGEVYSDALYGVSYANTIDAPVVLTKTNNIEDSTVELLQDLGVKEVTIIGGPLTVSESVEGQLDQLGITYNRIFGRNRYISSAEVAKAAYPEPENIVIASGEVFTDALVSAPLAQKLDAPILLVRSDRMEPTVESYLLDNQNSFKNIYVLGGELTISHTLINDFVEISDGNSNDNKINLEINSELFNQELLKLVNEERTRLGIEPLYYDSKLQLGADKRVQDLYEIGGLRLNGESHVRADGSPWNTAFEYYDSNDSYVSGENAALNYLADYHNSEYVEQIQTGERTLENALAEIFYNQYANSQGHYENMVRESFDGFAVASIPDVRNNGSLDYGTFYNIMVFSREF